MAKKATQTEMFEQKRIPRIETLADKYDEKRAIINGLQGEMKNIAMKMSEVIHQNASNVEAVDDPKDGPTLVYSRGDYKIVVKRGAEKVNVKIKEASKGAVDGEPAADEDEEPES